MALYAGEAVRIRVSAVDPETKEPLDPLPSGEVRFWHEADPAKIKSIRAFHDEGPFVLAVRDETKDLVAYIDTTGWDAGKWYFRVTVNGDNYTNWEYGSLRLKD